MPTRGACDGSKAVNRFTMREENNTKTQESTYNKAYIGRSKYAQAEDGMRMQKKACTARSKQKRQKKQAKEAEEARKSMRKHAKAPQKNYS